ncbi:MAG: U32 family peptidase [Candidatus Lambdaproteobacteria bacterium]|nr:U32 family peptidase [Candidatus Lambdaproteobacteria bacterium]
MFSVATNFDDALPDRLQGLDVTELFGSCDDTPVGHGRPRLLTPSVSWRRMERHVQACRQAGIGFSLLLNPLCLSAREESLGLERRLRRTLARAVNSGVSAVTVAHPWLVALARDFPLRIRISVFVGISTVEQARYWEGLGCHVLTLDSHVMCRDLPGIRRIAEACRADVELPVNIGCLLRCPLARTHAARLSHSSLPGAQPMDPCARWCLEEKRKDPVNLIRADFVRPEDLGAYRAVGVRRFKIVDRSCPTDDLVQRVQAYARRRWEGDLLELLGHRTGPIPPRRLPVLDALRHLGLRGALDAWRQAPELMSPSLPWAVDNAALEGLILPSGCRATNCDDCGHCARLAARAVRPRTN